MSVKMSLTVLWCDVKGVRYVCAFMEAEWDLCRLEMDGIIDAVASNDSDCFVLGCSTVIQLLDLKISAVTRTAVQLYGYRRTFGSDRGRSEPSDS